VAFLFLSAALWIEKGALMYSIKEILDRLKEEAPLYLKEEWDNVGLLVGDSRQRVSRVGVSLNVLSSTVASAVAQECSLLITHHPPFFSLSSIRTETPEGEALQRALQNNLSILSLHTNLDRASQGINRTLGDLLSLKNASPLLPRGVSSPEGDGALGVLERPLCMKAWGEKLRECWNLSWVGGYRAPCHEEGYAFSQIALLGGSGSSFWRDALSRGAELFVTAELKYHHRLEALQEGLSLIQVDHGEMEEAGLFEIARRWERSWGKELAFSYIPFQSWEKPAMLLWE
jgi:dinuclear metal center YbgI/SA1388 family protein